MATPKSAPRENLPSVAARKAQLFERDAPAGPSILRKPFAEYLRDTPATPLPLGVKAALWAAGVLVGLILLAALLRGPRPRPRKAATAAPAGNSRQRGSAAYADPVNPECFVVFLAEVARSQRGLVL